MTTSALKLVTGVLDGKSIRNNIEQTSHGFTAGSVVRFDPTVSSGNGGFTLAFATSPSEAEVAGIIEKVSDENTFTIVYQGEINISNFPDMGNTADECYFLSGTSAGHVSSTPPTIGGHVIKPILTRRGKLAGGGQRGVVMNYLGTVIGGEATVSLNGLMPVGAIQAYAGHTSGIPAQWSVCDGSTLDATRHADYYSAVSWLYGSWQQIKIDTLAQVATPDSIKQTLLDGSQANATVISWDNNTKLMVIDNITSDPDTGKIITETEGHNAQFQNTDTDGTNGLVTIDGDTLTTYAISEVSIHSAKKPDLRSRVPMGEGDVGVNTEYYERGQYGGERTHILTLDELPAHDHDFDFTSLQNLEIPSHTHSIGNGFPMQTSLGGEHSHLSMGYGYGNHNHVVAPGAPIPGFGLEDDKARRIKNNGFGDCPNNSTYASRIEHEDSGHTTDPFASDTAVSVDNDVYTYSDTAPNHTHTISIPDTNPNGTNGIAHSFDLSEYLDGNATSMGGDTPHNNLQPYLVVHYIIRISSEARASLIDGIDLTLSMEGLSNVNDGDPANDEMVRYNSTNTEYEKFSPTIQGIGSKDNEDVVIHTSQNVDGLTQEAMRITTNNLVYIGMTSGLGTTIGMTRKAGDVLFVKNNQDATSTKSWAFFQGGHAAHHGNTGSRFGHYTNATMLYNSCPGSNASRQVGIDFNNASDTQTRYYKIMPRGMAIGNHIAGASLDVAGSIRASGDICTHNDGGAGGTFGVYASILGVTSALGGYNLPVTAGMSGEVLMVCATGGGIGYTLEFKAQASATSLWSGHAATGASFGGTVGIGTGGGFGSGVKAGIFGALLEVGGGALIHGAMTADSLYVGGVQGSNHSNALISGLTASVAWASLKSSALDSYLVLDAANAKDSYLSLQEAAAEKATIGWIGGSDQVHMAVGGHTFAVVNAYGQVALGTGSTILDNFAVNVGTSGGGGIGVSAGCNLFYSGTGEQANKESILQLYKENASHIQFGTTTDIDGGGSGCNFSDEAGFFIGITANNHAEFRHTGVGGGTVDFFVGHSGGNTQAAVIHQDSLFQIGATGTDGAIPGIGGSGENRGLAVVDAKGMTGNSGDVLLNKNNTGVGVWGRQGIVGACHFTLTVDGDADASSLDNEFKNGGISAIALSSGTITITHNCGSANFVPMITANPAADADNDMYFVAGPTKTTTTLTFKPRRGSSDDPVSYFFSVVLVRL